MIAENAIDWTIPMKEEGRREGRREGRQEGRQEGEAEGLRKGEAALLLRLLNRRFGALSPAIEERVRGADAEQLLDWGERFVDATSLDEIFGGHQGD